MRLSQLGLVVSAAQLVCAIPTIAGAGECVRLAAAGDGLTKDIAVVMSTHGLQNIIEAKGLKGQGPVKTSCQPGTFLTECHSSQLACK
jgi:hypothetical protein